MAPRRGQPGPHAPLPADPGHCGRRDVAIFTVVNAVLLRPLPFPESERLVLLRHAAPQLGPLNDLAM